MEVKQLGSKLKRADDEDKTASKAVVAVDVDDQLSGIKQMLKAVELSKAQLEADIDVMSRDAQHSVMAHAIGALGINGEGDE